MENPIRSYKKKHSDTPTQVRQYDISKAAFQEPMVQRWVKRRETTRHLEMEGRSGMQGRMKPHRDLGEEVSMR
jgi:hypothetical protein